MINIICKYIFLINIFVYLIPYSTSADTFTNTFKEDMVVVSLVPSITNIEKNESFYIGLKFNLKPDWKIYWRHPGDSGMAPEIDFSESENLENFQILWPYPSKEYESANLLTNIYKRNIILPIEIDIIDYTRPLVLKGILNFQVCKEICIPLRANLKLEINPGISNYTSYYYDILKEVSNVPALYSRVGIKNIDVSKTRNNKLIINIKSLVNFPEGGFDIFMESSKDFYKIKNIIVTKSFKNEIRAEALVEKDISNIKNLNLIFVKGDMSFYTYLFINDSKINLLMILLLSLIGGFILNFMPCVLPVLALKISRILNNKSKNNTEMKFNFMYTSFGIISSFLFLALMTIILKYIGAEVGWGIQFQQPIFVGFLIFILIIFAANLFNIFEINLPSNLNNLINKFISNKKYSVSFFEGSFATLLATPCSAPFLGTAVGFALTSNALIIILVFIFLGIGMSLPYIFVCFYPKIINFFPKPGNWINYLRYVLGIGLTLTAVWLITILTSLITWQYSAMFIFTMFILFLIFKLNISHLKYFILTFSLLFLFVLLNIFDKNAYFLSNNENNSISWQVFDENNLYKMVSSNKNVFVDITADWCVTCKVNEVLVFNNNEFSQIVKNYDLILMRGDWTKPNKDIMLFMQKLERYGIPFNAIYNYKNPQGILFSELLTIKDIEKKLLNNAY